MAELDLKQRLAHSRQWLLTGHLGALEMKAMGADPWILQPPACQRMAASVALALRDLADHLEQQGVQPGVATVLLLDEPAPKSGDKPSLLRTIEQATRRLEVLGVASASQLTADRSSPTFERSAPGTPIGNPIRSRFVCARLLGAGMHAARRLRAACAGACRR